jgi:hypothetical protein
MVSLGDLFTTGAEGQTSNNLGTTAGGIGAGVGLGFSAFGGYEQYQGAKAEATASRNIAGLEIQQDTVRRQAMELSAQRQEMQNLRQAQRARSMALSAATAQGGQYGSALGGAYGQISGGSGINQLGISQNLQFGEKMFDLNAQIDQQKMAIADAKTKEAEGAGISSFGKSFAGSIEPIMKLGALFLA